MHALIIALLSGFGFIVAYHTYGRWLGRKIFRLSAEHVCPSYRMSDGHDYVPTSKGVVFGHHFTSIAGTGPIVGPAIAIMWGWLPALLWVIFGSILIGAVHDFGALVVSLRNNGQTVGDIAGRVVNRRVRLLFLFVLFMALMIVLAIFGLVIASVFRQFPTAIVPCAIQIPIAVAIGWWLHRKHVKLLAPSLIALAVMYLTVIYGDVGPLHALNMAMAAWSSWTWVLVLLSYSYIASVLPVWTLLQPRDYINALQLISILGLIVVGLLVAAVAGGAALADGTRPPLELAAPVINLHPTGAPAMIPFLFITFYLWRRGVRVWFLALPMIFMLIVPLWAMLLQVFAGTAASPSWFSQRNWLLVSLALATLVLEIWMIIEAIALFPRAKGVLEANAVPVPPARIREPQPT